MEDADEGIRMAKRARELSPESGRYHTNSLQSLGQSYYRAKRWSEALDAYKSIQGIAKLNPDTWLFIAMCHWQLKDQMEGAEAEARKWYEKSVAWREQNQITNSWTHDGFVEAAELLGEAPLAESKPDKTPPADQLPSPNKTPPANDAQDQPPGNQKPPDQTTDSDYSTTTRS